MFKRIAPLCIAAAVLILANGCCCTQPQMCGDVSACGPCDSGGCDSGGCETGCCPAPGLGSHLTSALTCGSGCGEVYWDEWINNPPACCDPCDDCGNWTGGSAYCAPNYMPLSGLRHLWGYRYAPAGCDVACDSCPDTMEMMPEYLPVEVEGGKQQQLVPPKPETKPSPAKQASAGRRVRHATYNRPVRK